MVNDMLGVKFRYLKLKKSKDMRHCSNGLV